MVLDGASVTEIAKKFDIRPNTVIDRRDRFIKEGYDSIFDRPRTGKPQVYGSDFKELVLKTLEGAPPPGYSQWDGPLLARILDVSVHAIWRLLRKEGICLARRRSWCVSTDPEFSSKAADIVGLYLSPPENALVLSVDEKTTIQALERRTGYVYTSNKKIVNGYSHTYKRHGTINLFAALEIATGKVYGKTKSTKKRPDFLEFLDELLLELPQSNEYHVILDNLNIHKKCDEWISRHKNVHFHYTPTSASWLNMIEIWFCIFSRKCLRNATFSGTTELGHAIEAFMASYNENDAHPFVWRKREVKGAQLKNTIENLCH